jgi:tRNA(Ile2) C34 agmatinyltransferase TiaS
MKIKLTEDQIRRILEIVDTETVKCKNCEWKWDLSDGGEKPFLCHKCGHDNG